MLIAVTRNHRLNHSNHKRKHSEFVPKCDVLMCDSADSKHPVVQAAIKRDSERFRKITDLSAKLAAMV